MNQTHASVLGVGTQPAAEPEPFKLRFRKQTGEDKLDSVWLEIAPEETDEEVAA